MGGSEPFQFDKELGAPEKSAANDVVVPLGAPSAPSPPAPAGGDFAIKNPPTNPSPTDVGDLENLGVDLASAMAGEGLEGFQPVVIFGTNNSGKTSLLLSLFSTLLTQNRLETGLFLADPILGSSSPIGEKLHSEARHTFQMKTQHFMDGRKTQKTNIELPFFIPVEVRPKDRPAVRFAFLESNGEWYRPQRDGDSLFPKLKRAIETFVSCYQGGIIFLYLVPYTQAGVYDSADRRVDEREVADASLAISGVLQAYNDIRATDRGRDRHLMLVSKWDAHDKTETERSTADEVSKAEVEEFCEKRYRQAFSTFKGLQLPAGRFDVKPYSAGIINDVGLQQHRHDYSVRLWEWLYRGALENADLAPVSPFPAKPQKPAIVRLVTGLLDRISG